MSDRVLIISGLMCSRTALAHDRQTDMSQTYGPPSDLKIDGWKILSNHRVDMVNVQNRGTPVKTINTASP